MTRISKQNMKTNDERSLHVHTLAFSDLWIPAVIRNMQDNKRPY